MYQQNSISAMMGAPKTPEEERMAQALRQEQTGGNMLALSGSNTISNLGQGMSKQATAGAKQMGTLAQAREQAGIAQTRHDENLDIRNRQLTQSIAANKASEIRRINDQNEKLRRNLETERLAREKVALQARKANINSMKNNHAFNNLSGYLGQEADVLKANMLAGSEAPEDPNAPKADAKIGEWAVANGADESFTNALIKDTNNLSVLTDIPASGLADAIVGGGEGAYKWSKYMHGLTGRTGIIPHRGKSKSMPRGTTNENKGVSENLFNMLTSANAYEPEYASTAPFVSAIENFAGRKIPTVMGGSSKEKERWHSNLNQFYTMPIRHEYFGSALTPTEESNWLKSAITPDLDDGQIRWAMATRLYLMRKVAETQIKTGLSEGYSQETMKGYYDYLADSEMGAVNPDTPEGRRLLDAGWNPGDPVEWYEEGAEEIVAEEDAGIMTAEEIAELKMLEEEDAKIAGNL